MEREEQSNDLLASYCPRPLMALTPASVARCRSRSKPRFYSAAQTFTICFFDTMCIASLCVVTVGWAGGPEEDERVPPCLQFIC